MERGSLARHFSGVAVKRLSMVETTPGGSNQHEFNGNGPLRDLFGDDDRRNIPARYIWMGEEQEGITADSIVSWYDSRRNHPTRTEYRLYYTSNDVTRLMREGDTFIVALTPNGGALVIITPAGSTIEGQLLWLFGIQQQPKLQFEVREIGLDDRAALDFSVRYILDEIGIELEEPDVDVLDNLIEPFGAHFPTTREFSALARESLPHVTGNDDPDATLIAWLEREEALFRRLERHVVAERLQAGFMGEDSAADVDGFLTFSLSVQNRRKSRAGHSLENHLEAIFTARSIHYTRGALTENRNRPDFLFPGAEEYRDPAFPASVLTMLASKSTLKDRWRQILSEAERIDRKHLLTLEPAISEHQTTQMTGANVQIILPEPLHATYRESQRPGLWTVSRFLALVTERQEREAI